MALVVAFCHFALYILLAALALRIYDFDIQFAILLAALALRIYDFDIQFAICSCLAGSTQAHLHPNTYMQYLVTSSLPSTPWLPHNTSNPISPLFPLSSNIPSANASPTPNNPKLFTHWTATLPSYPHLVLRHATPSSIPTRLATIRNPADRAHITSQPTLWDDLTAATWTAAQQARLG
ncbi:hypothetical protein VC83_00787 [Pseudogymnoascus destructans]|uniref:Uncharacterized protein n=1 Tax=Pseudogymnoascus destructans TaxID=655981 RepID=A0A177AM88_9PEZI|nr:uncharacterized protein VC83_00787 [Pseudogymnoascus destructans]OAF62612.1 hypothetical protein VC83_00787 [Pseudogymnoascus destructans]